MVAFARHMGPLRKGEQITIYHHFPGGYHHSGAFCGLVQRLGRWWIDLQERPGWPPLCFELAAIRRIERHGHLTPVEQA